MCFMFVNPDLHKPPPPIIESKYVCYLLSIPDIKALILVIIARSRSGEKPQPVLSILVSEIKMLCTVMCLAVGQRFSLFAELDWKIAV